MDVFDSLVEIASETGWVCSSCSITARETPRALQAGQAKLAEEVAALTVEKRTLSERVQTLEKCHANATVVSPAASVAEREAFREVVRKEVVAESHDKARR